MIKIGDICPLFFSPLKNKFQQDIDYTQRFHTNDNILVQVFSNDPSHSVTAYLRNLVSGNQIPVSFSEYQVNDTIKMYYSAITGLHDAVYVLEVADASGNFYAVSEPFSICSDSLILDETCLIRCSHKDNNSPFDNIFWPGEDQLFFEFRIEGGFKPNGYSAKVENEQFRNQKQEIIELYSVPYDTFALSCGNSSGIPYWFIQFINKVLCLSDFYVNGVAYVRSGNSVPEVTQISEDSQMFWSSVLLEKRENDLSGLGGIPGGSSAINLVGFNINNPKEGEMLQYDSSQLAFVNTDKIEV